MGRLTRSAAHGRAAYSGRVKPPPASASSAGDVVRASVRLWWAAAGLLLAGLGGVGLVVPGLPSVMFFIAAAWCFSRSSRRLERWLLSLPVVGGLVRDYRAGLGMPRASKIMAVATMWAAIVISAVTLSDRPWLAGMIGACGLIGTASVVWGVPTRERVVENPAPTVELS